MRATTPALIALVLILAFILCMPLLELVDYNDLVLTGQDLEISVLDMLTIFCVWFILVLRLFLVLQRSWAGLGFPIKASLPQQFFFGNWRGVLFLPRGPSSLCDPLPLLI